MCHSYWTENDDTVHLMQTHDRWCYKLLVKVTFCNEKDSLLYTSQVNTYTPRRHFQYEITGGQSAVSYALKHPSTEATLLRSYHFLPPWIHGLSIV